MQRPLIECPECGRRRVSPLDWREGYRPNTWVIMLRCGECELIRADVFDRRQVERYDQDMDAAEADMLHELRQLEGTLARDIAEAFA